MRVCLVNPPHITEDIIFSNVFQPIRLAYVAAALEQAGHEVVIIDALGEGWQKRRKLGAGRYLVGLGYNEIAQRISAISPKVVGVAAPYTLQAESSFNLASAIKACGSKPPVVMGGPHATAFPLECLNQQDVDAVIVGEGEQAILQLVDLLESGSCVEEAVNIPNVAVRIDGEPKLPQERVYMDNLDNIPFPARHLMPLESYFKAARAARVGYTTTLCAQRWTSIISSRGCPYKCIFCTVHKHMGRKYRGRSSVNVVNEITECVDKYGVNFISFMDDNLTFDKERILQICRLMVERRLNIKWGTPNGVRADLLDEELISSMKTSGCVHICVAPESGNQDIVDNVIKKKMKLEAVEMAVRLCKKYDIRVDSFFVIGLPRESKANIQETIDFAAKLRQLGVSDVKFHIAQPYRETELYDVCRKSGYLKYEKGKQVISTPEFTPEEVKVFQRRGTSLNPLLPIKDIRIVLAILMHDPARFVKLALRYFAGQKLR